MGCPRQEPYHPLVGQWGDVLSLLSSSSSSSCPPVVLFLFLSSSYHPFPLLFLSSSCPAAGGHPAGSDPHQPDQRPDQAAALQPAAPGRPLVLTTAPCRDLRGDLPNPRSRGRAEGTLLEKREVGAGRGCRIRALWPGLAGTCHAAVPCFGDQTAVCLSVCLSILGDSELMCRLCSKHWDMLPISSYAGDGHLSICPSTH